MPDHLELVGLLDIDFESNGIACGRFLRYVKNTHFLSPYLPYKLKNFNFVKIFLLEHIVDDVVLELWKDHTDLVIDHPLIKIGNIERVKFLHNEIKARKHVIEIKVRKHIIVTLIVKHIEFIIFISKQMIVLFTNFGRALMKLNQLKLHIMSKINIINPSKNITTNAFDNCISSLSIPLLLLESESPDVADFGGIPHIRTY
jgi:hypothetical protein